MIDPDAAMDDSYAEDNYGDYGSYEESYDESGMMDPNTGMPMATGADGNKGSCNFHYFECFKARKIVIKNVKNKIHTQISLKYSLLNNTLN